MDSYQGPGNPGMAVMPTIESDEVVKLPPSPISSEGGNDSSFIEGDSGNSGGSGGNTFSDPEFELAALDRDAAAAEILIILNQHHEISIELLDWARDFIEEDPDMLTRSSTIVMAHPDREKAHAEFHRGVSAICRIISDQRLKTVRDFAVQLEGEWKEALTKGTEAPRYGEYVDLMYSEAERVTENGEGAHRDEADIEIVSEAFGLLKKETREEEGDEKEKEGGATAVEM